MNNNLHKVGEQATSTFRSRELQKREEQMQRFTDRKEVGKLTSMIGAERYKDLKKIGLG